MENERGPVLQPFRFRPAVANDKKPHSPFRPRRAEPVPSEDPRPFVRPSRGVRPHGARLSHRGHRHDLWHLRYCDGGVRPEMKTCNVKRKSLIGETSLLTYNV